MKDEDVNKMMHFFLPLLSFSRMKQYLDHLAVFVSSFKLLLLVLPPATTIPNQTKSRKTKPRKHTSPHRLPSLEPTMARIPRFSQD
jgi:hypothetical protein